jgi:hypothetical protein
MRRENSRAISWINEEIPSDDEDWETVMKGMDTSLFPTKIKINLEQAAQCAGHLEQAQPSSMWSTLLLCEDKFETKYCELHGKYFAIFDKLKKNDDDDLLHPTVYNLKLMDQVYVSNYSLFIIHQRSKLQFRMSASFPDDSSISFWLNQLSIFIDESDEEDRTLSRGANFYNEVVFFNSLRIKQGKKNNALNKSGHATGRGHNTPDILTDNTSNTAENNNTNSAFRFRSSLFGSKKAAAGSYTNDDVIKKKQENEHHIELFHISNPLSSLITSSSTHRNTDELIINRSTEVTDSHPMPPTFLWMLRRCGIIKNLRNEKCKQQLKRLYYVGSEVSLLGKAVVAINAIEGCTQSIHAPDSKYPPCLKLVSIQAPGLLSALAGVIVYVWFVRNVKDSSIMFRSHRKRMYKKVEKFAQYARGCTFVSASLIGYATVFFTDATPNTPYYLLTLFLAICFGALYSMLIVLIIIPFIAFATLYYGESRRLRLVLKDFQSLLRKKPFNFFVISEAYLDLHKEWENANEKLGTMVSITTSTGLANVLFTSIAMLYNHIEITTAVAMFACVLPVTLINVLTAIAANNRVENLSEEIDMLLAHLNLVDSETIAPDEENSSVGRHGSVENNGSGGGGGGGKEVVVSDPHMNNESGGIYALRLAALIERKPCELRIMGKKIDVGDIYNTVLLIVIVQALNFLGVDLGIF